MSKRAAATKQTSQESTWRDRLARFASSGLTIEAFCRGEAISTWSVYRWRKLLGAADRQAKPRTKRSPASSIDLGSMPETQASGAMRTAGVLEVAVAGMEIRLDLGGGVVLTIARR
jgi:hypothetical protein